MSQAEYIRLDGRKVGISGIKSNTTSPTLAPGTALDYPRNDKRVDLILTNAGDGNGNPAGVLNVKCYPDDDSNNGYSGSNGTVLTFGGSFQFDRYFPWCGIVRMNALLSNTVCCIQELYDGG